MKKVATFDLPKKLREKRREIDLIDRDILALLNQRLRIARQLGKIKGETGRKTYDPKREKEVRERLKKINKGPLKEKDLEKIFGTIIGVCRRSQK